MEAIEPLGQKDLELQPTWSTHGSFDSADAHFVSI